MRELDKTARNELKNIYREFGEGDTAVISSPQFKKTIVDYLIGLNLLEKMDDASTFDKWIYLVAPTHYGALTLSELLEMNSSVVERFIVQGEMIRKEEIHRMTDQRIMVPDYIHGPKLEQWLSEITIFVSRNLPTHPLRDSILQLCQRFDKSVQSFDALMGKLNALAADPQIDLERSSAINNGIGERRMAEYDVFVSHANTDKQEYVEQLVNSLKRLKVNIFYDKDVLEWGDNWKQKILDGTQKAEFAIIVISQNFFGREWTETELFEFLNRQNEQGQKVILPILLNVTIDQLHEKYPSVAEIQCISSADYTYDQVALLFARQLIQRLKRDCD